MNEIKKYALFFILLSVHGHQVNTKYTDDTVVRNKRQCFIQLPMNDMNTNLTDQAGKKPLQNLQDIEAQLFKLNISSSSSSNISQSQVDMFINYLVEQSKIQSSLWSVNTTRASTINKTQSIYPPGMYFILKNIIINLKLELIIAYIKPFLCCI